jgi:hypothetical protein
MIGPSSAAKALEPAAGSYVLETGSTVMENSDRAAACG